MLADLSIMTSPVKGCRFSSMTIGDVLQEGSGYIPNFIVSFRLMTKPPLGQLSARSTPLAYPQAQVLGRPLGRHPYLSVMAYPNSPMFGVKPCMLFNGNDVEPC